MLLPGKCSLMLGEAPEVEPVRWKQRGVPEPACQSASCCFGGCLGDDLKVICGALSDRLAASG